MRKFSLTTKSQSGDYYVYFIEHTKTPSHKQLIKFLEKNGNDIYDDPDFGKQLMEEVEIIEEIKEFKTLK